MVDILPVIRGDCWFCYRSINCKCLDCAVVIRHILHGRSASLAW